MKIFLFLFLFLVSCSYPSSSSLGEARERVSNPCFQEKPSLDELVHFQNENSCDLFDYKYIYPLVNQSCDRWKKIYENVKIIHFTEIFIESEQRLVCFRQDYIESPAILF